MRSLIICIAIFFAQQATATVLIAIYESGGNVQADLSGSLDLNATLGKSGSWFAYNGYFASQGVVGFTAEEGDLYDTNAGTWPPFGTTAQDTWSSSSGDTWAMFYGDLSIVVPTGYVSGKPLSATATKNATTLAVLGFTPGVYVTTLTNGDVTDKIAIVVSVDPYPLEDLSGIAVEGSYIQLEVVENQVPPPAHCSGSTHHGRMVVDSIRNLIYVCTDTGWHAH